MKKIVLIFLVLYFEVYSQNWDWTKTFITDTLNTYSRGSTSGSTEDNLGNIIVVGNFYGAIKIDSILYTTTNSLSHIFIVKYTQNGDLIWSRTFGGTGDIIISNVIADVNGFFYITGYYRDSLYFDNIKIKSLHESAQPYISKFNANGNCVWATSAQGFIADDWAIDIAVDTLGNTFITGLTYGNIFFGNHWIASCGHSDIFVAKCDYNGNFLWAVSAGSPNGTDKGNAIAIDDSNNVYVSGDFAGTVNFGSQVIQSYGSSDIFLTKLDSEGDFIWTKHYGSSSYDNAIDISISESGLIAITGFINSGSNGARFDDQVIFSNGGLDIFIAIIDSYSSNLNWVQNFGSPYDERGNCIQFDSNSDIYFSGNFKGTTIFNDTSIVSQEGGYDIFVSKYNRYGIKIWVMSFGTTMEDDVKKLTIDHQSQIYVSGGINGTLSSVYGIWVKDGFFGKMYNSLLPVELKLFTASYSTNNISLAWTTSTELNNNGFEIERSVDNKNWATIGFVKGAGTTSEPQQYNFLDNISELSIQKLFYRLKQIDFNGSFEYSNIVEVEITPSKFALEQNYPNPFNPGTKISWQTPVSGWQTLKVYDILGNEVAILVDEYRNAGSYEVDFNPASSIRNPATGVYFYQLKVGNFVETKKMILLK